MNAKDSAMWRSIIRSARVALDRPQTDGIDVSNMLKYMSPEELGLDAEQTAWLAERMELQRPGLRRAIGLLSQMLKAHAEQQKDPAGWSKDNAAKVHYYRTDNLIVDILAAAYDCPTCAQVWNSKR